MIRSSAPSKMMPYLLMRIYTFFAGALRHNRLVFRLFFGYVPPQDIEGHLWDWTTLILRRALRRYARSGARLLDMGTGPAAVLGIYARTVLHYEYVCAVDHIPEIVSSARRTTELADTDIDVVQSSLFEFVKGKYDVIVFNAPYIDIVSGIRLGLLDSDTDLKRWSGGPDGMDTIDRFLADAGKCLTGRGTVLLGVNRFYIRHDVIENRILQNGWNISWVSANRLTHAAVYALGYPEERTRNEMQ